MLLEGIIHYHKNVESSRRFYDNGFFFDNWFVGEKGLKSRTDSYYSFFMGYQDEVKADFVTNSAALSAKSYNDNICSLSDSQVAIAAWFDESTKSFSLFRELFGKIPLFYIHIPDTFFAFSTSLTRLIALKDVQPHLAVDQSRIPAYISLNGHDYTSNASSTFFAKIKSVLPGHLLTVNSQNVSTRPHVQLNPGKWAHLTSTEYNEELARLFKGSVSYASKDCSILGSHLSGGLDSSSVSSALRYLYPDKAIHTFHIPSTSKEADEREYAEAVANHISSKQHFIDPANDNLASLQLATELYGQPENGFLSPATNHKTLKTAQSLGCDVLLNGFGGDSVIGDGSELVIQSFHQKDYELFQELLKKRVNYFSRQRLHPSWDEYDFDKKYHLVLQNALYRRFSASSGSVSKLLQLYREVSPHLNISLSYFFGRALKSLLLRTADMNTKRPDSIIRSDLRADTGSVEPNFPQSLRGDLPSNFQELLNDVFHPQVIRTQEQDFVLSCHYGVSNRAPFMDKELFELNMAIPNILKFGDGIGRAHFRESMKGILIDKVRTRGNKATVSSSEGEKMALDLYRESQDYLDDSQEVWMYVDKAKFQEQVKIAQNSKIPFAQKTTTYALITRTISLSIWLNWLKSKGYNS